MAIKFADTYFNYGDTVRSAPIPGPTRGRETSASGLAEGLGRGCRLIVDAHLFFFSFLFLCFAFICMYWYLKSTRRVLRIWRFGYVL